MGGSADTPTTPESLRASDAERDHAVSELRDEFAEGRLSHETFIYRMQTALGARNRGQLEGLFTDLPPRRTRLLSRIRAALKGEGRSAGDPRVDGHPNTPDARRAQRAPGPQSAQGPQGIPWAQGNPGNPEPYGVQAPRGTPDATGRPAAGRAGGSGGSGGSGGAGGFRGSGGSGASAAPAPLVFPPGSGVRFTIGRTRDCDLCLTDLSVSRMHAQLVRREDGWLLSDLGSHNGTRVNGWLVREPVPVRAGDRVEFGSATFVIQGDSPGEARPGESLGETPPRDARGEAPPGQPPGEARGEAPPGQPPGEAPSG